LKASEGECGGVKVSMVMFVVAWSEGWLFISAGSGRLEEYIILRYRV
jgi:hypothetical protein